MKFISLEPFIPSGSNFELSKRLFQELGFAIGWDAGDFTGFYRDDCKFILQKYDNKNFAENLMLSISVSNVNEFWNDVTEKKLAEKFGIKIGKPTKQAYGLEVNIIDLAGVCWHFVQH